MTVVYVAGTMRSGTTVLGQALAAEPDLLLLGEVRPVLLDLREPGGGRCDCGAPEAECPFWSRFASHPSIRTATLTAWGTRALPRLLRAVLTGRPAGPDVEVVVARLRELVAAAGERTVVDTSKSASGILLWRLAGQRVQIAHCLRSPARCWYARPGRRRRPA